MAILSKDLYQSNFITHSFGGKLFLSLYIKSVHLNIASRKLSILTTYGPLVFPSLLNHILWLRVIIVCISGYNWCGLSHKTLPFYFMQVALYLCQEYLGGHFVYLNANYVWKWGNRTAGTITSTHLNNSLKSK